MKIYSKDPEDSFIPLYPILNKSISVIPNYGSSQEKVLEDSLSIDNCLLQFKTLMMEVLSIEKSSDRITYFPGILDYRYVFNKCPFLINNVLFKSLTHFNNGEFILSIAMYNTPPKDSSQKYIIEREISLPFTQVSTACDTINYVNRLIENKFEATSITDNLQSSFCGDYFSEKSIFLFLKNAKIISWTNVSSRVGKDNSCSSGLIIEEFYKDNYLLYLMKILGYSFDQENRLKKYYEDDYSYMPSEPYLEKEIDGEGVKFEITKELLRLYNQEDHRAFTLLK